MTIPDKSSKDEKSYSSNDIENLGNNIPSTGCSFASYYFLKNNLLLLLGLFYAIYAPKAFSIPTN